MKEFKNIPSKLYEKTDNWIAKEKNITKTKYSNNFKENKPKPRRIMSASAAHSHRNLNPGYTPLNCDIYNINNKKNTPSMFENYYHDKMVSKRLIPSQEEEKAQQMKDNLDYQFESHLRELRACNNIESQINEQYESIKKAQLKANTPSINDKGLILQKNNNKKDDEIKEEIESKLAEFEKLQFKKIRAIKMSTYYSIFLQVKVDENITMKQYLSLEKEVKSQLKSSNKLIRFIDIEPL